MTPEMKTWHVTALFNDGTRASALVDAVNKRFAKWNAEKELGHFYWLKCRRVIVFKVPAAQAARDKYLNATRGA